MQRAARTRLSDVTPTAGTFDRNSRIEFVYYATWGLIGCCAVGAAALKRNSAAPPLLLWAGCALFVAGEAGNASAHWHLK